MNNSHQPLRVTFLVPSIHLQAPLVLREWLGTENRGPVQIVTTPKLATKSVSPVKKLIRIARETGFTYLVSQALMTRRYMRRSQLEDERKVPIGQRVAPTPQSLATLPDVELSPIQSINSKEGRNRVREFSPDVMVSVFFNQIIKPKALAIPKVIGLNVHPSFIPSYRGISPVFWVLANGETNTGFGIHELSQTIDEGDVFARGRVEITESDSYASLYRRIAIQAGISIRDLLTSIQANGRPQALATNEDHSYYSKIRRSDIRRFRRLGRAWSRPSDFSDEAGTR